MISILITAKNEEFLQHTIDSILKSAKTPVEILVGLDGVFAEVKEHPQVKVFYKEQGIGQRAMLNFLARQAKYEWLMKLDAHIILSDGFDKAMLEDMEEDICLVPQLLNLHAYDWKCSGCGAKQYQGLKPQGKCCKWEKDIVWQPQPKPIHSTFYFNSDLVFEATDEVLKDPVGDVMTIQGMVFLVHRDKYFELNLNDESFGSWGSQGNEIALKYWLTGGRVKCTKKAWLAHLFRGFEEFPYERNMSEVHNAHLKAKRMFMCNNLEGQTKTFQWLIEKFNYPLDWTPEKVKSLEKTCNVKRNNV